MSNRVTVVWRQRECIICMQNFRSCIKNNRLVDNLRHMIYISKLIKLGTKMILLKRKIITTMQKLVKMYVGRTKHLKVCRSLNFTCPFNELILHLMTFSRKLSVNSLSLYNAVNNETNRFCVSVRIYNCKHGMNKQNRHFVAQNEKKFRKQRKVVESPTTKLVVQKNLLYVHCRYIESNRKSSKSNSRQQ